MSGQWWVCPLLLGIVAICLVGIIVLTKSKDAGGGGAGKNDDCGDCGDCGGDGGGGGD